MTIKTPTAECRVLEGILLDTHQASITWAFPRYGPLRDSVVAHGALHWPVPTQGLTDSSDRSAFRPYTIDTRSATSASTPEEIPCRSTRS